MDKRGKHSRRGNKVSDEVLKQIDEHIRSFPSRRSHHSRGHSRHMKYLSPDLSVAKMHDLYLQSYEAGVYVQAGENARPSVTYVTVHAKTNHKSANLIWRYRAK